MTDTTISALADPVREWERGAWCLAALALAARGEAGSLTHAARDVLEAAGVPEHTLASSPLTPAQIEALASAGLLKTAGLLTGRDVSWADQSDDALRAQGQASGIAAAMFAQFVVPNYPELGARLAQPGARMLDVGTGVGALGAGFAIAFPALSVTGIDVMPRVLELAQQTVAEAGLQERMELRLQDVAALDEEGVYDLAWLPAPFVPERAFTEGVRRIARALRPGGMVMIGHGRLEGPPVDDALTRLQTIAYGGTPIDGAAATDLLTELRLGDAKTLQTPPGAPGITVAFR
ncbi:MAG: cyclopropane-fatty-acyl-phospholipid synthase family protein [Jatrophihabitans sp.]|uniref:SAM-dependent methyltransferase n=1 Tax=Jatrophihabitans sp. TaxID=1932789 RepID=UPI003914F08B